jgi:hypothetical protein
MGSPIDLVLARRGCPPYGGADEASIATFRVSQPDVGHAGVRTTSLSVGRRAIVHSWHLVRFDPAEPPTSFGNHLGKPVVEAQIPLQDELPLGAGRQFVESAAQLFDLADQGPYVEHLFHPD